jgi:hypothetical protein
LKKILRKITFILIIVFFAIAITGCVLLEFADTATQHGGAYVRGAVETGIAFASGPASKTRTAKKEFPLIFLRRISKGVCTVWFPDWKINNKEAVRNNAINLLVQFMGYESYDFKMTSEPKSMNKVFYGWGYSVTMPGSIPVVRDEKYSYKIADTTCTPVPDTTFGKSKINAITYGDGKFVAVGDDKKMAYSQDGITWTDVNNKAINFNFEDITYGNGKFVAVGYYGEGKIAYSSDGENWIEVKDSSFKKDNIGSIAYGNGMFVAAAKYDNGKWAYSPDGRNWTQVKTFPFRRKYIDVVYCEGKFFVLDRLGDGKVAYSQDGVNWTAMDRPLGKDSNVQNLVYGNGKFLAVGNDNTAYSTDGINWTAGPNYIYVPMFSQSQNRNLDNVLVYGDGKFVSAGEGGKMAYSQDGINWITIADSSLRTYKVHDIVYGNGKFIVAGDDGKMIYWDGNIE